MRSTERRVYTTFKIEIEALGKRNAKLIEQAFLFNGRRGDATQPNFAAVGARQNDIGAAETRGNNAYVTIAHSNEIHPGAQWLGFDHYRLRHAERPVLADSHGTVSILE